jgi:uncharacterized protein (UPF0335 family)
MAKSGFAKEHLKSFIDRIERLEEERSALTADIREVYSEAKGQGYDGKIMRRIVQLRKMDTAEYQEYEGLLDTYKRAMNMLEPLERAFAAEQRGRAAAKEGSSQASYGEGA